MLKKLSYASASILMLAFAYHLGAASSRAGRDRIVTRELVVTDDAGRQRATITVDSGGPHLSLADEAGYPTVMLIGGTERATSGRGPYGGYLAFYDSGHRRRAQLGFRLESGPDGWPASEDESGFALYGGDGKKTWTALH